MVYSRWISKDSEEHIVTVFREVLQIYEREVKQSRYMPGVAQRVPGS
jgi:hypothetical protein